MFQASINSKINYDGSPECYDNQYWEELLLHTRLSPMVRLREVR